MAAQPEMAAQPGIVQRAEQPYVAIRALVTMQTLGEVLPPLHPEVNRWLRSRARSQPGSRSSSTTRAA